MNRNSRIAAVIAVALLCSQAVVAEPRYITDQTKIMMRSGESTSHQILRQLPSGHEVEALQSNQETGYTQIQTSDGLTGFVLTRQLMPIPSARDRLVAAEAKIKELEAEPGALSAKLSKLQKEHKTLSREHGALKKTRTSLERELESIRRTAANAIRISEERTELRKQVAELTRELEEIKQENRDLGNENSYNWFLAGGGTIVFGILLGLILPRLRIRRRRDSWGSL